MKETNRLMQVLAIVCAILSAGMFIALNIRGLDIADSTGGQIFFIGLTVFFLLAMLAFIIMSIVLTIKINKKK